MPLTHTYTYTHTHTHTHTHTVADSNRADTRHRRDPELYYLYRAAGN